MHPPIRRTVPLSAGTVSLRAWGAHVADAYLHDLLMLSATLGLIREQWPQYRRQDLDAGVWGGFWRLVQASLDGSTLPRPLTWDDRLLLLDALWELNDLEAAEGKLQALNRRVQQRMARLQGEAAKWKRAQGQTTPTTRP